ncbi:DUF4265 domain-containing protein [Flavobacterium psychrophilum]|uniref:DUF4265 domain-containing protein n=1 Tax=Flavobacterium psychrophilum TaxID=96345 RepID=A0A7U2NFJ3_FLAPS|nr:DUF4265 domain-containing protein [Flavobacterium psychrophilum]QRE04063.1 DUF4265 domain-containing protein [Flavobacterium psychrophilum]
MEKEKGIKVNFDYYDLEENLAVESVWALKEKDYYRIKNIPFFAPNIAYDDLISVEEDEEELFFDDIIEASGNSTLQIVFFSEEDIKTVTNKLESFLCGWEGSHLKKYISVNVPKEVDYHVVKDYLNSMLDKNKLDYKEACLAHNLL